MSIEIGARRVGAGQPCYFIAEAGVNHNGDMALARQLIDAAAAAGADAVKFQTFKAEKLVTATAPKAAYQQQNMGGSESQFEMLKRLELLPDMHQELQHYCAAQGIAFLSTPFDEDSADFLESLGVAAFKIPSGELTNLPFLQHLARKGLPMIVSTGMSYLSEVEAALHSIQAAGDPPLILLHCVSNYPAAAEDSNLRAMHTLHTAFNVPVGYSDHTLGLEVPLAAVAMGAVLVEKHFTLDRTLPGPDHAASLEPEELRALVAGIRKVEAALGDGIKRPTPAELDTAAVARKSLITAQAIPAGAEITAAMITIKRPGTGLPPAMRDFVLGRRAARDLAAGEVISLEMLA